MNDNILQYGSVLIDAPKYHQNILRFFSFRIVLHNGSNFALSCGPNKMAVGAKLGPRTRV